MFTNELETVQNRLLTPDMRQVVILYLTNYVYFKNINQRLPSFNSLI